MIMATGKRINKAREGVDPAKAYPLDEAVKIVKERAKAKFDETVEVAMNLGVDPRHADQMVRGVVNLPNGTGPHAARRGVRARRQGRRGEGGRCRRGRRGGPRRPRCRAARSTSTACIATPDLMPLVGRLGKVLGPRGMMPNPKVGTVTMDIKAAVEGAKGGSVEFRVEKAGIVQAGVGKASFSAEQLVGEHQGLHGRGAEGKAPGRQGPLHQPRGDLLHHGPGREDRAVEPGEQLQRDVSDDRLAT